MTRRDRSRGLTTLLFTDIAGSTEIGVAVGDRRWRHLQARHHAEVRKQLKRHRGHEVDTAGDGFFATFQTPDAGVRCASAIVIGVRELGLDVRAGVHVGEVERAGEKAAGVAVTTAARVGALASAGQVLVTSTVAELVAGSGLTFEDARSAELKGIPGTWRLLALTGVDGSSVGSPLDPEHAAELRDRASPPEQPGAKRRRWVIPVAAATALLVVTAGVVLSDRNEPGSDPTSSQPAPVLRNVAVLDATTGEPVIFVEEILGTVHSIVLASGGAGPQTFAWMGSTSSGSIIVKVDRSSGTVVSQDDMMEWPCSCLEEVADRIWSSTLGQGDDSGNAPLTLVGVGPEGQDEINVGLSVQEQAFFSLDMTAGDGHIWLGLSGEEAVHSVNIRTGQVERFPVNQASDFLEYGSGRLWMLSVFDGSIRWLNPTTGRSSPRLFLPGSAIGIAVGGGFAWVIAMDEDGGAVYRVAPDNRDFQTISLEGDLRPTAVVYGGDAVWVATADDQGAGGAVTKIDPLTRMVLNTYPVTVVPDAIAVDEEQVWVAGDRAVFSAGPGG